LYAEAQRRYLQSFSAYTRQFLERLDKPDADRIDNLPPAIAVAQRAPQRSQRATVGSLTEVVDYLRLLFARSGSIYCLSCGQEVRPQTTEDVLAAVQQLPEGTRFVIAFLSRPEPDSDLETWADGLRSEGFVRVQVGGTVVSLDERGSLPALLDSSPGVW